MSALTRWEAGGSGGAAGMATLAVAGEVLAIRLESFEDAQALAGLIDAAERKAGDLARRACAVYMRGAVNHIEATQ